jgi:hypothetical protein
MRNTSAHTEKATSGKSFETGIITFDARAHPKRVT